MAVRVIHTPLAEPLKATAFVRVGPSELERLLAETTLTDSMTLQIRYWYTQYCEAVRGGGAGAGGGAANIESANLRFFPLLKEILQDPVTQDPLDENAMLGSDGKTYSSKTLFMHSIGVPAKYKNRSPLYPEREEVFTSSAHPIARYLVEWLSLRDGEFHEALRSRGTSADDYSRQARIRIVRARHAEAERARAAELAARRDAEIAELEAERAALRVHLAPADRVAENTHAAVMDVIGAAEAAGREERDPLRDRLDHADRELAEIQAQIPRLRERQAALDGSITAVEREDQRLDVLFAETAAEIKKSKRNELADVITAVAIVGACMYGAWALQQAAAAGGSSGTAYASGTAGGGMIGMAFSF